MDRINVPNEIMSKLLKFRPEEVKFDIKIRKGIRVVAAESFFVDDYRFPDTSIPVGEYLENLHFLAGHNCSDWEADCPCKFDDWISPEQMPLWASRLDLISLGNNLFILEWTNE